jgi:C1A family cysteine protease
MSVAKRKNERYGWVPDLPDPRDHIYNLEETILQAPHLPPKFSLRKEMPPVYNQGELGSCTANAIAAILEHREMREGEPAVTPSRLFIYYEERAIEGTIGEDAGAQIRDGIKVVANEGAPPEEPDWPYDITKFAKRPPKKAYKDAKADKALQYQRIVPGGLGAPIRTAVNAHHPVAFGFSVPASFENGSWDPKTQVLPVPGASEEIIGGHAVDVVGWDFSRKRFKSADAFEVRNSWDTTWGDKGYFWMDAAWFNPSNGLTSDFWVISQVA